jgi:hypothetical protein
MDGTGPLKYPKVVGKCEYSLTYQKHSISVSAGYQLIEKIGGGGFSV